nr:phage tail protein [Bilophila wadsworthia]
MKRLLLLFLLCFGLALPGVAADGTSFNPTTISVKSVGASIPVGTVITWPSNSWPSDRDNWLECNGQSISSAVYPELVGVVGSTVPDYRGLFLRGQGSQSSYHYGTVTHSSAGLGQLQGDAIREIWGDILTGAVEEDAAFSGAFRSAEIGRGGDEGGGDYGIYFRASWVTPVAQEVRPVNRSVRYLIRAK